MGPTLRPRHQAREHSRADDAPVEPVGAHELSAPHTLEDVLTRGPLELERALELLAAVADALDAAQARGIVHPSLQPATIRIDAAGGDRAVVDFGSDWATRGRPPSGAGSEAPLQYVSPEQILGRDGETSTSGVFSLSAVLYRCLTGRVPVLFWHPHAPRPRATEIRPDLPAAIDQVLARGMAIDPAARHPTATALMEDARQALETAADMTLPARSRTAGHAWRALRLPRAKRSAQPLPMLAAGCLAALCALFVAFPEWLGLWGQLGLLLALVPAAVAIHLLVGRVNGDRRRVLGPLVLFTLAFVFALGPRAISLAVGNPGRFFVIDRSGATVSAFAVPPGSRERDTYSAVRNPTVEGTTRDWGKPISNASSGFVGTLVRAPTDGFDGSASAEARMRTGIGASYVAIPVGEAFEAKATVKPGRIVSGSLAAKSLEPWRDGSLALNVTYYGADHAYVSDERLSGRGAIAAIARPRPDRWYRLYGTSRVPSGASFANLNLVIDGFHDRESRRVRLDAAVLAPHAASRTDFRTFSRKVNGTAIWDDVAVRALGVSITMLLAVFLGYLLPLGVRIASRVPELQFPSLKDRRTRRVLAAFIGIGVVAYAFEMSTYGGYGGYLATFSGDPGAGLGRFYIRTLATLTTGAAVFLLARRISVGRAEGRRPLEIGLILLGFAIAASYWLKAVIAIPLLTVLLFWHFTRRRALIWFGLFAGVFALLTPFVYQVRGEGSVRIGDLVASSYWSEFFANLQSRFFHFESLMIVIPFPHREHAWQPVLDFFSNIVPRVLWQDKPLSTNARFTEHYLKGGLHQSTDVGVISLPGEMWLIGGWVAVILAGFAVGVLLRSIQALIASPTRRQGTVLLAATLLTMLLFANDGWGLASTAISVLILCVGWLVLLRRVPVLSKGETVLTTGDKRLSLADT